MIATVHALNRELQIPVSMALRIAHELWRRPSDDGGDRAALELEGMALQIDRHELRTRVDGALASALEMAPRTRRGRPRQKESGRTGPSL
ncbi:MAG: hypothetical protein ACR2L6_05300 [Gemmatimonadaceae bacterium]